MLRQAGSCLQKLEIGVALSHMSFHLGSSGLLTEIGLITLDRPTLPDYPPVADIYPDNTTAQETRWRGYSIGSSWNGQNVLWLPPEFRPSSSAVVGSTAILGSSRGRVLLIRFAPNISPIS